VGRARVGRGGAARACGAVARKSACVGKGASRTIQDSTGTALHAVAAKERHGQGPETGSGQADASGRVRRSEVAWTLMNVAVASLIALILAIVLSMTTRLNVGLAALVFAWLIGTFVAHLGADTIVRGFPSALFLTLTGMTLLFAAAETNGTLEGLAHRAVAVTRGRAALLPPMFFAIAFVISMI